MMRRFLDEDEVAEIAIGCGSQEENARPAGSMAGTAVRSR
jgi:hypothetical protein